MTVELEHDGSDSYRELYELSPCGLISTLQSGLIRRVNRTFATWVGREPDELIGKKRLQDLLTVGCKIFHQTHWMPLLQIQGSVAEVQLEFVHRDGHAFPVLVNAQRRMVGEVMHHEIAVFVASDRRKYERELLLARQRAEELLESERKAQDSLSALLREQEQQARQRAVLAEQLVGIVSHDLRTPLNAVSLGANLLATSGVTPTQARTVSRIASATSRAVRLIADLLDFTQARLGGGLRVTRNELALHDLVADCIDELKLAWPGRMFEHMREGEGAAHADADRLAQVVTNLATNALTYGAPERAITITSSIDEQTIRIAVHNHGSVIPAELLVHMFEPLRRGEQQVKLGSRSVGLGLYIVQQIATAHGGDVTVHSRALEGTTFSVCIPSH
jgi:sigma-B regulation protein RsbU (phosphoserine phosphatase)